MTDSGNANQRTLDGEIVEEDGNTETKDDGSEMAWHETAAGYNRFDLGSLYQKCIRRGQREAGMFAAFELCRSGDYDWFWERSFVCLIEDCRLKPKQAHLVSALKHLKQLAYEQWDPDEGMGLACAMRAASLLCESESSHEILYLKEVWEEVAQERGEAKQEGREPEYEFPVSEDLDSVEHAVLDTHTYRGSAKGRGFKHFLITSARTAEMSELEREYKSIQMTMVDEDFTEAEREQALSPTDRGDPWTDDADPEQASLDETEG